MKKRGLFLTKAIVMFSSLFPIIYLLTVIYLLWQAFKVMRKGFFTNQIEMDHNFGNKHVNGDRTGRVTVHPELLDQKGRITNEELLTVRFSGDSDPPEPTDQRTE